MMEHIESIEFHVLICKIMLCVGPVIFADQGNSNLIQEETSLLL